MQAVVPGDSSTEAEPVARSALAEELERAQRERDRVRRQQTLFDGLRFFLNRETPRASLTFVIRCDLIL